MMVILIDVRDVIWPSVMKKIFWNTSIMPSSEERDPVGNSYDHFMRKIALTKRHVALSYI
jgi:hypothetical protein